MSSLVHFGDFRLARAGAVGLFVMVALAAFTGVACEEDARSCTTREDCFGNEVCQEGICFRLDGQDASAGEDAISEDATVDDSGGGSDTGDDSGGGADTSPSDSGSQCQVDPFEDCIDDDEYQPGTATSPYKWVPDEHEEDTYETMGCWSYQDVSWGDVFGPAPDPVQGKLCPASDEAAADEYNIIFDQCSYAYSFDVYVRVTSCEEHRDALQVGHRVFGSDMEDYCDEQSTDGSYRHFVCHTGEGDFEYLLREDVTDDSGQLWDHQIKVKVPGRQSTPVYYRSTRLELSADPAENVPLDYEVKIEVNNPGG